MRAVVYAQTGEPEVLHLVERPVVDPGPGQVRVRVSVSGVNPTDWKARLGIPALTAQICLTASEVGPRRLSPGALSARTVLVAGGAGAVGHAAIQLARWAGARVIATVSGDQKARLARAAGAQHIVNYR